jgi:hypothetical protein
MEIRFNLMAVCEDLKLKAERDMNSFRLERAGIAKALRNIGEPCDTDLIEQYPDA